MDAPSAAQLIASMASMTAIGAGVYATKRGSRDTRDNQRVAHRLEEERDEFGRAMQLLDKEREGRARDVAYEQTLAQRERERADRERESGQHWHDLYREEQHKYHEEQHENAMLRNTVRELALVIHQKALAAAAIDGVTAADLPPITPGDD